jgi:CubicO group peptidase (beta-lactamase class C family)
VLLGIIIHRATGKPYGDFLQTHVFQPLGMSGARVNSEADIVPNRAAGYQLVNDTLETRTGSRHRWPQPPTGDFS